jgi:hypothetical protein
MSFMSKIVRGVGQAVGLISDTPKTPQLAPPPMVSSTDTDQQQQLDAAAQTAAAGIQRGRTSTLLTGGAGTTEDQKYTSKILLGQ